MDRRFQFNPGYFILAFFIILIFQFWLEGRRPLHRRLGRDLADETFFLVRARPAPFRSVALRLSGATADRPRRTGFAVDLDQCSLFPDSA